MKVMTAKTSKMSTQQTNQEKLTAYPFVETELLCLEKSVTMVKMTETDVLVIAKVQRLDGVVQERQIKPSLFAHIVETGFENF